MILYKSVAYAQPPRSAPCADLSGGKGTLVSGGFVAVLCLICVAGEQLLRCERTRQTTRNRRFKRQVRDRAARNGESYTTARQHVIQSESDDRRPTPDPFRIAVAQMKLQGDPRDIDLLRASGNELRQLMRSARAMGSRLVHFPEGATCFPNKQILSRTGPDTVGPSDWTRFRWEALHEELEETRA